MPLLDGLRKKPIGRGQRERQQKLEFVGSTTKLQWATTCWLMETDDSQTANQH